jgi:heterotetrameric sarcosine oxidase alpha subunit
MTGFQRKSSGGHIDRSKPLAFTYNGKPSVGFQGDTIASALLANNHTLIGRSFKYHRPRGFMSAGIEEPNGLFTLGEGADSVPNVVGTTTPLEGGLKIKSQNAWPSPHFDVMAINSLAAPLFTAGFYYKTFMGPFKKSWMFYEPFIRRAAGLGKATPDKGQTRFDSTFSFCDVLVIGSGPTGLAAAVTATRAGAQVVLAEQDSLLGGSLLSSSQSTLEAWRTSAIAELSSSENIRILTNATVQGLYDHNQAVIATSPTRIEVLQAKAIVHATGAFERPLLFDNNDKPGVMLAGAVRTFLNRYAVSPKSRAVIATNNDSAYAAAFDLAAANVAVTICETRAQPSGDALARAAQLGIAVFPNSVIADVVGDRQLQAVKLGGRHAVTIECDVLGTSGGWNPAVHLTSHGGIKPVYNAEIASFIPGGFAEGQCGAGAVMGQFGMVQSMRDAARCVETSVLQLGFKPSAHKVEVPHMQEERPYAVSADWHAPSEAKKVFVDFQNDVTLSDVIQAHQEGYSSVEHLKRYTTLGMGTDQGKTSNINALAIMAQLRGVGMEEVGTTTFRPPFAPLSIGAIAGRNIGKHFRPTRRSPLHAWHAENGGVFIEAGLWQRAWYYTWAGNTPEIAYIKEMEMVRSAVGIADVSTLGKIDVQGPDAAEFLNRVYVNGFAKLPIGKARYGVMLNDDGIVLDDGTTSRISESKYYMTTTTAQAGEVMTWLEYLLQCHWPELDVHVTSLTDEWGGMAVSGPQSREALQLAFPDEDISNITLPYMAVKDFSFRGTTVRLMRLSFSGELAYEVHCPANHVIALWEHILRAAAPLGIKPYGLEALASLRIEKGHVAGLELDHRNSLDDLGLGKMASKEKSYIGKELRFRENLQAPERWSLVGLELLEPDKKLRGGAILFAATDNIKGHGRGYITSVTWSTELKKFIALGLYNGGLSHEGEEIIAAFPLKNEQARLKIVSPHFIDKDGVRLHA